MIHKAKEFVKVPLLPLEEPRAADLHSIGEDRLDNENLWVWNLWQEYISLLHKSTDPLNEYLTHFKKFEVILRLDPDAYAKELEGTEENPRDVQELKQEIFNMIAKEEETKKLLPETIKISIYLIELKTISKTLAGKYNKLAANLKDIIAARAKKLTLAIHEEFAEIFDKINRVPANIEELTDLQTLINNTPSKLVHQSTFIDD